MYKYYSRGQETYIRQIDGRWYAFGAWSYSDASMTPDFGEQVCAIGEDAPMDHNAHFVADWCDSGIKSVSHGTSRSAAYKRAKRHGEYCGIG